MGFCSSECSEKSEMLFRICLESFIATICNVNLLGLTATLGCLNEPMLQRLALFQSPES